VQRSLGRLGSLVAGILFAGCSDGGASTTRAFASQVFGEYNLSTFSEVPFADPVSGSLAVLFDGAGSVLGDLDGDGTMEARDYVVLDDRTIDVAGIPVRIVTPDSQVVLGGLLDPGVSPHGVTFGAAAKSSRGSTTRLFAGRYTGCSFSCDVGEGTCATTLSSCSANGEGELAITARSQSGKADLTGRFRVPVSNGSIGGEELGGSISISGEFLVVHRRMPGRPAILVALRAGTRAGTGTLHGDYVGYGILGGPGDSRIVRVRIRADGAGACLFRTVFADRPDVEHGAEYSVEPDGDCSLTTGHRGAVSADGTIVVLADTEGIDGEVGMVVAIRRG